MGKRSQPGRVYQRFVASSLPENAGLALGPKKVLPSPSKCLPVAAAVPQNSELLLEEWLLPSVQKNFMHRPYTSILIECPTPRTDSRSDYLSGNWLHVALLILSVVITTGCSSAISMREALRDSIEQAAAVSQLTVLSDVESDPSKNMTSDEAATASYAPETPDSPTYIDDGEFGMHESYDISLDIETAVSTLSETNSLDTASKAALVETLEMTPQADWPVVIEEFTATLNALRTTETAPALYLDTTEPDTTEIVLNTEDSISSLPAIDEEDTSVTALQEPVETMQHAPSKTTSETIEEEIDSTYDSVAIISSPMRSSFQEPDAEVQSNQPLSTKAPKVSQIDLPVDDSVEASPTQQTPLTIHRPCIAQKVLGWGMVEAFPQNELCAGSEVIVYFELTGIESHKSNEGFETSVETALRLDDAAGQRLHSWSFPPLVEVCASVRRDYFARFFVELPSNLPPGDHQLILTVTDSHAGTTAETMLPFAIAPSGFVAGTAE
tara:strand:- start:2712 stop:4202 length:1491 start_codon:yes stop_codon:yes gene_type:complete